MVHVIGGLGTVLVLGAYFFVSTGRLASRSFGFQGMNFVGAVLLAIYGFLLLAWATVALNIVWGVIAIIALAKVISTRRRLRSVTDE